MKERYGKEVPAWLRLLGAWRINTDSIDFRWGYFAPRAGLGLVLNRGTYFDQRYAINICLGWWEFLFYMPFKTRLEEGCDMPRYGFSIHNDTFWIYKGGDYEGGQCQNQWIAWYLPFFSWEFDGHWIKDKHHTMVKMDLGRLGNEDGVQPWAFRKLLAYSETHPYTYVFKNGTVQHRTATCTVEKRKWHRKWFPMFTRENTCIDIEFNDEVGERTGSWKGGVLGCSYDMLPDDTIETCLRRMERERTF